jgi:hypothetical protein
MIKSNSFVIIKPNAKRCSVLNYRFVLLTSVYNKLELNLINIVMARTGHAGIYFELHYELTIFSQN